MFLVALTGGIGSGKSKVAKLFSKLGAEIIDSDDLAREVVAVGTSVLSEIVNRFGNQVLKPDGSLNRTKLAEIVFSDPVSRKDLEQITHPKIRERAKQLISESKAEIVVYEIPLLLESSSDLKFDLVVTVETNTQTQLERLKNSRGMSEELAMARINSQTTRTEREKIADFVIDSSGSLSSVDVQVRGIWAKLIDAASKKGKDGI